MTLRQLRYLIAVAEERSFTRAADRLYVSQPALSHQVRALERSLGATLLERLPTGVRLTALGEAVLPHAMVVVDSADAAARAADSAAALDAGEVRLGTLYSIALGVIPTALQVWRADHPAVRIDVSEFLNIEALTEGMLEGTIDVGVGPAPERWDGPVRSLGTEELLVVLPDGDPLLARHPDGIPLAALAQRPWVLYVAESGFARVVEAACREAGFTPRAAARTHNTVTALELAAAGLGPALVPDNVIGAEFAGNVRSADPPVLRPLVAFARDEGSPPVRAFMDVLVRHALRR